MYPGPPIYFTEFIFGMVVAIMYKIMGNWKNGGWTAASAENRRMPPIFLPFLAELDDLESFETMLFFSKKFSLMTNPAERLLEENKFLFRKFD